MDWMDGWIGLDGLIGYMDGWMDGLDQDGWIGSGWMDGWMYGRTDGWMYGCVFPAK